jgi:hypothetical protein
MTYEEEEVAINKLVEASEKYKKDILEQAIKRRGYKVKPWPVENHAWSAQLKGIEWDSYMCSECNYQQVSGIPRNMPTYCSGLHCPWREHMLPNNKWDNK